MTPHDRRYFWGPEVAEAIKREENDMTKEQTFKDAFENMRPTVPMEDELWVSGCDLDTAHFVAKDLRRRGLYLVNPENIGWEQIRAFNEAKGQSIYEDAGGYLIRKILRLFGIGDDSEVITYREKAKALLESAEYRDD